ncbi:MAG: hypothetical protein KBS74_02225 [Clostridiales bacterium]|nr:hypothetical protein [Candidatus Cacconaster stercorequi]
MGNNDLDMMNTVPAEDAVRQKIGEAEIRKARAILEKYKEGKANLEKRVIENEQYWKMRHWENLGAESRRPEEAPKSGWLVNVILNRHADAMDNYPEPNCLPRAEDDVEEAQRLSRVLPVILRQCGFRDTYSDVWWAKLKYGCGVYGVFWDASALNGLGDISIRKCDLLNLFWEPGVTNIQESRNLFQVELIDNEVLEEQYPQLKGKLKRQDRITNKYHYDDSVDTSEKSSVVDWYYKRRAGGRDVLHYCKFVGDTVLYATENDTEAPTKTRMVDVDDLGNPIMGEVPTGRSMAERGWYDHGKYPFHFDVLFPEEGTPGGFGYIDICKSPQEQIDLLNKAIIQNAIANSTPRFFIRDDGSVNEEEFADWTRPFIHTNGNLGQDSILPVQAGQLNGNYLSVLQTKIQELRETSGNTETATGAVPGSVTAAGAIAALQEASGKLSRDMIDATYATYEDIVLMAIDLIRQFYDLPRQFRITGDMGKQEFTSYDNRQLQPKIQVGMNGENEGYRTPVFDIEVSAQSESRYTKQEYNNLALELYGNGMFNPEMADQVLVALDMMDFKGKDAVQQKVSRNQQLQQQVATLQQQLLQMAQLLDQTTGTNLADGVAGDILGTQEAQQAPAGTVTEMPEGDPESPITARARQQTKEAAKPR